MGAFEITGGKRLRGELIPQGAKNPLNCRQGSHPQYSRYT